MALTYKLTPHGNAVIMHWWVKLLPGRWRVPLTNRAIDENEARKAAARRELLL